MRSCSPGCRPTGARPCESRPLHGIIRSGRSGVRRHVDTTGPAVALDGGQPLSAGPPSRPGRRVFGRVPRRRRGRGLPGSRIEIEGVGLNPTRTAWLDVLRRAGASEIELAGERDEAGEPIGTHRRLRTSRVEPVVIAPEEVPLLIDELPALAALGAFGGAVEVSGAGELRHKESDRITALVAGLRALGMRADERADGFVVRPSKPRPAARRTPPAITGWR